MYVFEVIYIQFQSHPILNKYSTRCRNQLWLDQHRLSKFEKYHHKLGWFCFIDSRKSKNIQNYSEFEKRIKRFYSVEEFLCHDSSENVNFHPCLNTWLLAVQFKMTKCWVINICFIIFLYQSYILRSITTCFHKLMHLANYFAFKLICY